MIRRAAFSDVPGMLAVLTDAHARSVYAESVELDEKEANRLLCQAIQRHGSKSAAGTWVQVAEASGKVEGLIVGALQPIYLIGKSYAATDLFWTATAKCPVRDRMALMLSMADWSRAHPKVVELQCGVTGIVGDYERIGKILERMGMVRFGAIYRMGTAA